MTRWLAMGIACFLIVPSTAAATASVHPLLRAAIASNGPLRSPLQEAAGGGLNNEPVRVGVWIRSRDGGRSLELAGLVRAGQPGPLHWARWTLDQLRAAALDPNVESIRPAVRCFPSLDSSVVETGAEAVHAPTGMPPVYHGATGRGVVIGIVDTGIDFHHADFVDPATGTTRVLFIWDQTADSANPPGGFDYGYEWTAAQIDAGRCDEIDEVGHGTHVAGIAAGNGAATGQGMPAFRYVGMAPEASLIVVKTSFTTTDVADGVRYIFQKADSLHMPAVVNLSLGTQFGPHDGTDDFSVAVNQLAGKGHSIVAAAGNDFTTGVHARTSVVAPDTEMVTLDVPPYSPSPGADNDVIALDGWYAAGTSLTFRVVTPYGTVAGPVKLGEDLEFNTLDGSIEIDNDSAGAPDRDRNVGIYIHDKRADRPPVSGIWKIEVQGVATGADPTGARLDLWNYYTSIPGSMPFLQGVDATDTVTSPATADSVIGVGAYVTKVNWVATDGFTYTSPPYQRPGSIAFFSSAGPRRDGAVKPDVAAPGRVIGSALSRFASFDVARVLQDRVHAILEGTSTASPHVTGLVALIHENYKSSGPLSVRSIRDRLTKRARIDAQTGSVPNPRWGYGKIDAVRSTGSLTSATLVQADATQAGGRLLVRFLLSEDAGTFPLMVWRQDPGDPDRKAMGWSSGGRERTYVDSTLTAYGDYRYWLRLSDDGAGEWIGPALAHYAAPGVLSIDCAPNPFVDHTRVLWSVPYGRAAVSVLSLTGRRIRSIATAHNGTSGSAEWDGADSQGIRAPAGVYLLRLSIEGGRRMERKIIKLR